jgi:hypothetical protein
MYNSNMILIYSTTHSISKFPKYAKKEILGLILLAVAFIVLYVSLDYMFLPSILNYDKTNASSPMLKVSMLFIYIVVAVYIVGNSKNDNNPDLNELDNAMEIDYKMHKFSIKFNNMLHKDFVSLVILLIITIVNIVVLYFGGLHKYTLSTGYELTFEAIMMFIGFIVLYLLYVLMLFIFAEFNPTENYVRNNMLKYITVNADEVKFTNMKKQVPPAP